MTFSTLLPILKVLVSFGCMLVGIRFKIHLFFSILIGSFILALLFGMNPVSWIVAAGDGITQSQTLFLASIIAMILALSGLLDQSGQAQRLLAAIGGRIKRPRLALAFFPALIGLLPMPGGAVFSAPMVRNMADRLAARRSFGTVAPMDQSLINYWYRHIWELAWPLYPGVILCSSLSGISLASIALLLSPAPILSLILGWYYFLRPKALRFEEASQKPREKDDKTPEFIEDAPLSLALWEAIPLLVAIIGAIVMELLITFLIPSLPFEWGVLLALGAAFICSAVQNRYGLKRIVGLFAKRHLLEMMGVVASIYIFKEVLQQSGAIDQIGGQSAGAAALFASAMFLPFFVGAVSGINVAFVGAAFPLLLGLIHQMGLESQLVPYVVLGMFAGYAGVMSSPLHLCFILTCQYFGADLSKAWRRVLVPCGILLGFGVIYFFILRAIYS